MMYQRLPLSSLPSRQSMACNYQHRLLHFVDDVTALLILRLIFYIFNLLKSAI